VVTAVKVKQGTPLPPFSAADGHKSRPSWRAIPVMRRGAFWPGMSAVEMMMPVLALLPEERTCAQRTLL
jgi:hypothetical protein